MGAFFGGLAIVFALLLFGRGKGGAPPTSPTAPGQPFNPRLAGPLGGTPALPGAGPGGGSPGCGCSSSGYTPPVQSQTTYGNVNPAVPNSAAPASSGDWLVSYPGYFVPNPGPQNIRVAV